MKEYVGIHIKTKKKTQEQNWDAALLWQKK